MIFVVKIFGVKLFLLNLKENEKLMWCEKVVKMLE